MTDRKRLSLKEQVDFVDRLVIRCVMRGGGAADETTLVLTAEDAEHLKDLSDRLFKIAPYEERLRAMVRSGR